jgi:hypothetical protein
MDDVMATSHMKRATVLLSAAQRHCRGLGRRHQRNGPGRRTTAGLCPGGTARLIGRELPAPPVPRRQPAPPPLQDTSVVQEVARQVGWFEV